MGQKLRAWLIWSFLTFVVVAPLGGAAINPLLEWRGPIYIFASFAGVIAMAFMLLQPLLVGEVLPGFAAPRGRRAHRVIGALLAAAVTLHVVGLWIFSPPDVIDVLLFRSPTPFSIWGVLAMWAVFGAGLMALVRKRLPLRLWRLGHSVLVLLAAGGTILHVVLVYGLMPFWTKILLCILIGVALGWVLRTRRAWAIKLRRSQSISR